MSLDALSFDLDGTLVETAGEIAEAVNRTLADFGVAAQPVDAITRRIGHGLHALMLGLLARLMLDEPALAGRLRPDAVLARLDAHYAATVGTQAAPFPGVPQALQRLAQAGVRLACVTNKEERHARLVLQRTGLDAWLPLLVGGDTLAQRKPHASVLIEVARRLAVPRDRLAHVGDSRVDVESARNAGVIAWAVPHGYNAGVPVAQAGPDRLFAGIPEIAEHVLQRRAAPPAGIRR
jgi:phosphoglycolate phosphatase